MAEDWAADVRKYAPNADDGTIAAIVRHCGIALRNRDSSLVSFSDATETGRVRDGFCRKKLGLTDTDAAIDAAIAKVGERMRGDPTKNRVTVYYLLAEELGKLGLFGGASAAGTSAAATALAAAALTVPAAAAPTAAPARAAAVASSPVPVRTSQVRGGDRSGAGGTILAGCGAMAAIIIGTAAVSTFIGNRPAHPPAAVALAPQAAATPAPATVAPTTPAPEPAIPQGSGVVAEVQDGKPLVSVYFDTAKSAVSPDFATVAAPVKTWIDGHAGARLAVSGFNDPRGNAAFNAELSKNRAKSVRAALTSLGVSADVIDLVKPADTTDAETNPAKARRVDIVIKDGAPG